MKLNGTQAAAVMGLVKSLPAKKLMKQFVLSHHGISDVVKDNVAANWKRNMMPLAIQAFEDETLSKLEESPGGNNELFSDGFVGTVNGVGVVIDCSYGDRDKTEFRQVIQQARKFVSAQVKMAATGKKQCIYYQWSPCGSRLETVNFDNGFFRDVEHASNLFLESLNNEVTNLDKYISLELEGDEEAIAARYKDKHSQIKKLTDEANNLKAQLIDIAKETGREINSNGVVVSKVIKKGSIDYKKIEGVDFEQYRKDPVEYYKVEIR